MSTDTAAPRPIGLPPHEPVRGSAEHATIELREPAQRPAVGEKVELVGGYSDTTMHLHEEVVGIRGAGSSACGGSREGGS